MLLSELIEICKYSELNSLAVKDNTDALVSFVNMGLLDLYSQFPLRTEEHIIDLLDGVTVYDLPADFMYMTGAYESPPADSVLNATSLPINEEGNPLSINTINFNQVQVPLTVTGTYVGIIYVSKPVKMVSSDLSTELPIPDQLVQPLLNFVAFKAHGGITTDGQSEGDIYFARYKRSCEDIKRLGVSIASDDFSMAGRVAYRGFP